MILLLFLSSSCLLSLSFESFDSPFDSPSFSVKESNHATTRSSSRNQQQPIRDYFPLPKQDNQFIHRRSNLRHFDSQSSVCSSSGRIPCSFGCLVSYDLTAINPSKLSFCHQLTRSEYRVCHHSVLCFLSSSCTSLRHSLRNNIVTVPVMYHKKTQKLFHTCNLFHPPQENSGRVFQFSIIKKPRNFPYVGVIENVMDKKPGNKKPRNLPIKKPRNFPHVCAPGG